MRDNAIPDEAFWTIADAKSAYEAGDVPRFLRICTVVGMRAMEQSQQAEVRELISAGWMPELSDRDLMPFQWAWRRPTKRPGKPGRRFASTGQAYGALQRERRDDESLTKGEGR
jgi:hypothetical protein